MKVKLLGIKGTWREVADAARTTIGMEEGTKEPTERWKRNILLAEHSPIRKIQINWKWYDLKSWVSVHFVRHHVGITHWVSTQRDDRTSKPISRDNAPQNTLVTHEGEANPQAIINMSRKRLCGCAAADTKTSWLAFLNSFRDEQPELYSCCVPECVYRGFCPELKSCGYYKSDEYKDCLKAYRKGINE